MNLINQLIAIAILGFIRYDYLTAARMVPTSTSSVSTTSPSNGNGKTTTTSPISTKSSPLNGNGKTTTSPISTKSSPSNGKTTSFSGSTTSSPMEWTDPNANGRPGNPGARIRLSKKAIDLVHAYANDQITHSLHNLSVVDFNTPLPPGQLVVKPPRVTESKFANVDNELIEPNRVKSKFSNGRITANGDWQYKAKKMEGTYKATIVNAELNLTSQLSRTTDAKPSIQVTECKAYLGQFRVDIQGAGDLTVIENCKDPICDRIRSFYEDAVCNVAKALVKDLINGKLATFPARSNVDNETVKLDYGLRYGEPEVSNNSIMAGLEGKTIWKTSSYVPFQPNLLHWTENQRLFSFELSDYTFNTLFHQSHSQGHRFSVAESLSHGSIRDQMKLNCTSPNPVETRRVGRRYRIKAYPAKAVTSCLGSVFDNVTNFGHFSNNDTGDLVFKTSHHGPSIFVQSAQRAFFDASNGQLEIHGPSNDQGDRKVLARAEIRMLRGEFVPKFQAGNITGTVKITTLQLDKPTFQSIQSRAIADDWQTKLAQFAMPLLTEMFNNFLTRFGQFSIPMLHDFDCATPDFKVAARTMQVNCDPKMIA